ncbi:dihydrofolate reductase [Didymella heteroderae]|uniref:Dihydrofolate reductase n=1 Tax=Didymella heteroderae TaxID=1769908 RepID=A0A9P5BX54_9PLEO|nr:dihydrofolate reductase [Didymella heteroderae]
MSNLDISPTQPTHAPEPANPAASTTPSTMPHPKSLTLILAATPSLGIGRAGQLPWPQLRKEMGYFARVTSRVSPASIAPGDGAGELAQKKKRMNAVVMGRKTWESIPERYRPLKGRVNVVVTRSVDAFKRQLSPKEGGQEDVGEGPIVVGSVGDALSCLHSDKVKAEVDRVMVIGGASIYEQALRLKEARHVLLTKIQEEYECDTFFSEDLNGSEWKKASEQELKDFTGEDFKDGVQVEEKGVKFEFCLYNRVD